MMEKTLSWNVRFRPKASGPRKKTPPKRGNRLGRKGYQMTQCLNSIQCLLLLTQMLVTSLLMAIHDALHYALALAALHHEGTVNFSVHAAVFHPVDVTEVKAIGIPRMRD